MKYYLVVFILIFSFFGCKSTITTQKSLSELLMIKLPCIKIDNKSSSEAVDIFIKEWQKASGQNIPSRIVRSQYKYINNDGKESDEPNPFPCVTCDMSDIPAYEFIRILPMISTYKTYIQDNTVIFIEKYPGLIEDWTSEVINISPKSQKHLGLAPGITPEELLCSLKTYNIVLSEGFKATWDNNLQKIIITAYPEDIGRLKELLFLIDNGYEKK